MFSFRTIKNADLERVSGSLAQFLEFGEFLFERKWRPDSAWELSELFLNEINEQRKNSGALEEKEYWENVFNFFDADLLEQLIALLNEISGLAKKNNASKQSASFEETANYAKKLEVNPETINSFFAAFSENVEEQKKLKERLDLLVDLYNDYKFNIFTVVPALSCGFFELNCASFAQFKKLSEKLKDSGEEINHFELAKVFRFLGQAFFSNDAETKQWATDFLLNAQLKEESLLTVVLLHLSFLDFSDYQLDIQAGLIKRFFLQSARFAILNEKIFKQTLANALFLPEYILRSTSIADALLDNGELLRFNDKAKSDITVGSFLKNYLSKAGEKDLEKSTRDKYVSYWIESNKWPVEFKECLQDLISLYLHLRECDLIDYRGILSDAGAIPQKDWSAFLQHDLSETELKEVEEYMWLLRRPTRLWMELIVAFQKMQWDKEPYLQRILMINEIYERVCGPRFMTLVYFDEAKNKWELNRNIPNVWGEKS